MRKLFLGNLAWQATADDVRELLDRLGVTCYRVEVILEQDTGRSRGFGFAHFETDAEAEAARQALDGADLLGRPVHVEDAVQRDGGKRGWSPRGGDGGRGGGRGGGGRERRGRRRDRGERGWESSGRGDD